MPIADCMQNRHQASHEKRRATNGATDYPSGPLGLGKKCGINIDPHAYGAVQLKYCPAPVLCFVDGVYAGGWVYHLWHKVTDP